MSKKYIDADASRDEFMEAVYSILTDDDTNDRANEIIDIFDTLPDADVEPVSRWISVNERLPEDGRTVLVWCAYLEHDKVSYTTFGYDIAHQSCGIWSIQKEAKCLAWQDLPEEPKMDGGSE